MNCSLLKKTQRRMRKWSWSKGVLECWVSIHDSNTPPLQYPSLLEFDDGGAPGKTAAESVEQDNVAGLNASLAPGFIERYGN